VIGSRDGLRLRRCNFAFGKSERGPHSSSDVHCLEDRLHDLGREVVAPVMLQACSLADVDGVPQLTPEVQERRDECLGRY